MTILFFLDILAELIFATYQLGKVTRKVVIPALVFTYVSIEYVWDICTTVEYDMNFCNRPLAKGFA